VLTDGPLTIAPTAMDDVQSLHAAVWGQGFPAPVFDEIVEVVDHRVVGGKHLKLRVKREDGSIVTALRWNALFVPTPQMHIVFRPVLNSFQGITTTEFMIDAWQAANS
jgi:single-stranded-DNA-specific exonuclease